MSRLKRAWKAFWEEEKEEPQKPTDPAPTPKWVIQMTLAGAGLLVLMGILVLVAGAVMWSDDEPPKVSDRPSEISRTIPAEESSTTTAETETQDTDQAAAGTPDATQTKESGSPDQKKESGEKKEQEEQKEESGEKETDKAEASTEQITRKWPTAAPTRNETLALALLATGAALLLAGAFAARITSIKLPGGVELAIAALREKASVAGAALGAAAEREGKSEVLKDPEKFSLGVRKLLQKMDTPSPEETALRALGALGAEGAPRSSAEQLEAEAKRVLDEIS